MTDESLASQLVLGAAPVNLAKLKFEAVYVLAAQSVLSGESRPQGSCRSATGRLHFVR